MGKIKRLGTSRIRKITGGKDPVRLIQEFMVRRGFDPDECLQQQTNDQSQWLVSLGDEEELEITLEGLVSTAESTLYMGVNVFSVPLKDSNRILVAALIMADTLIGAKLSLVNYDLVLSVTAHTGNMGIEEVDYYYELIMRQKIGIQELLADEIH